MEIFSTAFYRKDHLQKHLQTHNKLFIEQNIFPVIDRELMEIKQEILEEDVKPMLTEEQETEVMQVRSASCGLCLFTGRR